MCYCKSAEQKIQSGCWAMESKVCKASGSMVPEHTCGLTISSLLNSQQGSKSTSEIEPKKFVRGGCTCCMPGCCSDMKQDLELPFHKFPKDKSTKEQRIDAMKRKDFCSRWELSLTSNTITPQPLFGFKRGRYQLVANFLESIFLEFLADTYYHTVVHLGHHSS